MRSYGGTGSPPAARSARGAAQVQAFLLGQAAPHAEAFVVGEGVVEARGPHLAHAADALGIPYRTARFREEEVRPGLRAQGLPLPVEVGGGDRVGVHAQ